MSLSLTRHMSILQLCNCASRLKPTWAAGRELSSDSLALNYGVNSNSDIHCDGTEGGVRATILLQRITKFKKAYVLQYTVLKKTGNRQSCWKDS